MNARPPLRRVRCASFFLAVLLGASALRSGRHALAQESDAERLFREGRALIIAGRFAEACPKLERSQRLEPRLGTKLNVAFCHERLGKIATAWSGFREALSTARANKDVEREKFARARLDALEPRVPWLRVRGAPGVDPERLAILLDGAPLAPSTWEDELPADPGEHTLVATHGGDAYWQTTVTLGESEHVLVAIPAHAASTKAASTKAASTKAASIAPRQGEQPATRRDGVAATKDPRAAERHTVDRFVYEVGAFVGFLFMATKETEPEDPASIRVVLVDDDGTTRRSTCASAVCGYLPIDSAGLLAGAAGFVGYAATPNASLGLRFLLGPRAGGGALVALGPSVSFRLGERFSVGPTVLFGTASHAADGLVAPEAPMGTTPLESDAESRLRAALGFSMGLGAELGLKLVSGPTGSVVLQATPLFLYGSNGTAFALPLGVAYRWD